MEATIKQDLPPPGGYRPINVARNPAKTYFRGAPMIAGFVALNTATMYYYFKFCYPKVHHLEVEKRGAYLATQPLLLAERDRAFLKQIKLNVEEEAKLMANVPDWEVGKWRGEKIYKTLPNDSFVNPSIKEFYAHSPYMDYFNRAYGDKLV